MAVPPEIRFWKYAPQNRPDNECWIWEGYIGSWGYGRIFSSDGRGVIKTHRLSYEIHKGKIPKGMLVRHTCDNPACVNPNHLIVGTDADNARDKAIRRRAISIPDSVVRKIFRQKGTCQYIADKFGVSGAFVCLVKNRKIRQLAIGG